MIEIFRAKNKQFAFRIKAKNGRILCHSETYKRKASVFNAIKSLSKIYDFTTLPAKRMDLSPGALCQFGPEIRDLTENNK